MGPQQAMTARRKAAVKRGFVVMVMEMASSGTGSRINCEINSTP